MWKVANFLMEERSIINREVYRFMALGVVVKERDFAMNGVNKRDKVRHGVFCGLVLASFSVFLVMGGCEGLDRSYESMVVATDPDRARMRVGLKWMNPQPRIRPVSSHQMYVYCRVRNSSGADIDLDDAVRSEIEKVGYRLTRNIDEAQFTINADLRFVGESAYKTPDALLGGAGLGAIGGAVLGHNIGKDNTGKGALIGAAVGGLIGDVVANRNKMREFTMIVDVTLGERIRGGVVTQRGSRADSNVSSSSGLNVGGGFERGSSSAGSSESSSVEVREDFLYHENRVVARAERLNLTFGEAAGVLTHRLSRALSSALP